jgi:hypothetical protein
LWLALNSLQRRLAKYLMARPGQKIPKGELCDLARNCEQKYTGETPAAACATLKLVST